MKQTNTWFALLSKEKAFPIPLLSIHSQGKRTQEEQKRRYNCFFSVLRLELTNDGRCGE